MKLRETERSALTKLTYAVTEYLAMHDKPKGVPLEEAKGKYGDLLRAIENAKGVLSGGR